MRQGAREYIVKPEVLQFAVSDETTEITTGAAKITLRMPYAMTLQEVRASLGTGCALTVAAVRVAISPQGQRVKKCLVMTSPSGVQSIATIVPWQ